MRRFLESPVNIMVDKRVCEKIKFLEEEIKKLEEERDFFKEQAILWRNDYKNEYEEIKKLKEDLSLVIKVNKSLREENKRLSDFLECEA